jgi:hypothetical protein
VLMRRRPILLSSRRAPAAGVTSQRAIELCVPTPLGQGRWQQCRSRGC